VDVERHQVVDLLPELSAGSLAAWILTHSGVKIISRDRGGIYAEGARRGRPEAEQVADRFHLLKGLREALEPLLNREHASLPKMAIPASQVPDAASAAPPPQLAAESALRPVVSSPNAPIRQASGTIPEVASPATATETRSAQPPTRAAQIKHDRRQGRQARYAEIVTLSEQGMSLRGIAQQMGIGRQTVRRFLAAGAFPEITPRGPTPSILDKLEPL
jgi:hypothetical protein